MKRSDFIKTVGLSFLSGTFLNNTPGLIPERKLIKPKKLNPGDTVGLTAPAGILYDESEFVRIKQDIESLGLNVHFGEFVRKRHGYFAGRDYQRALDLNRFFANPDIDGIISVRGGWGCSRILPYLDFERIRKHPKIYCGFSDNTTLHLAFLAYSGLVSYHGPNGASEWNSFTKQNFKTVLMEGGNIIYRKGMRQTTLRPGVAEGPIIGGNLTVFTTSLGTPYEPDLTGAILFFEDIGEPAYKIDRMLTHLSRAGKLSAINGFIFGQCTDCDKETDRGFTRQEVIEQHIGPLNIPTLIGMEIGHDENNLTIPIGLNGRLDAESGTLELLESAVV